MFEVEDLLFDLIRFEQEVNPREVFLQPSVKYVRFFIDIAGEEALFFRRVVLPNVLFRSVGLTALEYVATIRILRRRELNDCRIRAMVGV